MKYAIITPKVNPAAINIKDALSIFTLKNTEIHVTNKETIYLENIDKEIEADLFIFATKHSASSEVKTLTIHPFGNWGKAELGGKDSTLCIAPASYIKKAFLLLNKFNPFSDFQVSLEQTHHGPYISKPGFFIEIGSTEKEWNNKKLASIIAETLSTLINNPIEEYESTIVLGSLHYNQLANKILLTTKYSVGHICSKYFLDILNENLLKQAIEKTIPNPKLIILEWKGLGKYKQKTISLLDSLNLKYKRWKEIKQNL